MDALLFDDQPRLPAEFMCEANPPAVVGLGLGLPGDGAMVLMGDGAKVFKGELL